MDVVEEGSNTFVLHSEDCHIFENTLKISSSNENVEKVVTGLGYDETNAWFIIYLAKDVQKSETFVVSYQWISWPI